MEKTIQRMRKSVIAVISTMVIGVGILSYNLVETNEVLYDENKTLVSELAKKEDDVDRYQKEVEELKGEVNELMESEKSLTGEVKDYKKKLQDVKKENEELKKKISKSQTQSQVKTTSSSSENFTMTYYTATCNGCSGYTATGANVKNSIYHNGYRVLSVDKSVIPLGSIVEISNGTSTFKAQALDTGSAIVGKKLDLLVSNYQEAISLGKDKVSVKIIRKGW